MNQSQAGQCPFLDSCLPCFKYAHHFVEAELFNEYIACPSVDVPETSWLASSDISPA